MIRVLLVDDQRIVRAGLRMLCEAAGDITVVDEAGDGGEAERLAHRHAPDVVLMDLRMPGTDRVTATRRLGDGLPASRVLVLTTFDDEHLYPAPGRGRARLPREGRTPGVGDRRHPPRRLRGLGVQPGRPAPARRGGRNVPDQAGTVAARRAHTPGAGGTRPRRRGKLGNGEIAARLHLGVTTVKTHVGNLMAKAGTNNPVRLAVLAARGPAGGSADGGSPSFTIASDTLTVLDSGSSGV